MREIKEDGWMPVDRRKNVGIIKLLAYIENMGHLEAHYLKKCQQKVLWYTGMKSCGAYLFHLNLGNSKSKFSQNI